MTGRALSIGPTDCMIECTRCERKATVLAHDPPVGPRHNICNKTGLPEAARPLGGPIQPHRDAINRIAEIPVTLDWVTFDWRQRTAVGGGLPAVSPPARSMPRQATGRTQ